MGKKNGPKVLFLPSLTPTGIFPTTVPHPSSGDFRKLNYTLFRGNESSGKKEKAYMSAEQLQQAADQLLQLDQNHATAVAPSEPPPPNQTLPEASLWR